MSDSMSTEAETSEGKEASSGDRGMECRRTAVKAAVRGSATENAAQARTCPLRVCRRAMAAAAAVCPNARTFLWDFRTRPAGVVAMLPVSLAAAGAWPRWVKQSGRGKWARGGVVNEVNERFAAAWIVVKRLWLGRLVVLKMVIRGLFSVVDAGSSDESDSAMP